jgi:endoglucanase
VLDLHAAPGGQTGANIDDSYGYPFIYESAYYTDMTVQLWRALAQRYKDETIILGYELLNEPISTDFNTNYFSPMLEPLYKKITTAIREVDKNHMIILDGAVWASQFHWFGTPFDSNLVYTFHKYWVDPTQNNIQEYIDFGNKYNVPIWMGESGENSDTWIETFRVLLEKNGVSWAFWPYKKLNSDSCVRKFWVPQDWSAMVTYIEGDRSTTTKIAQNRPPFAKISGSFRDLISKIHYVNTVSSPNYIRALGLTP